MKKTMIVILLALIVAIALSAMSYTYRIRDDAGAELLWNPDQAYVFINVAHRGYHVSYLRYFTDLVRERLGGVTLPNNEGFSVAVLRVRLEGVQTYNADNIALDFYTPFQNVVLANHQGELWEWAGDHFQQAPLDVKEQFQGSGRKLETYFTNLNGWSKHYAIFNRKVGGSEFSVEIGGKKLTFLIKIGDKDSEVSIDLLRPDEHPERIWFLDTRTHTISRAEYQQTFSQTNSQAAIK